MSDRDRALDCLLAGRIADVAVARDWPLLREIARLAQEGPPADLAASDPGAVRNVARSGEGVSSPRLGQHDAGAH